MHTTNTAAWHETGFCIRLSDTPEKRVLVTVENLNPQVETRHVMSRSELRRVALWMLWKSITGVRAA